MPRIADTIDRSALQVAICAAIGMPVAFAIGTFAVDDPAVAPFCAFGSFALLVMVEFAGPPARRLAAYGALVAAGALLIPLGTVCSHSPELAAAAMTVLAFAVIFLGIVDGYVAAATSALLLLFILPVMIEAPDAEIPARLAGWGIACAVGTPFILALAVLAPRQRLRAGAAAACDALAPLVDPEADPDPTARAAAHDAARRAIQELRLRFLQTPYRPTGPLNASASLGALVDEVGYAYAIIARTGADLRQAATPTEQAARRDVATALRASGTLLAARPGTTALPALDDTHHALRDDLLARVAAPQRPAGDPETWRDLRTVFTLRQLVDGAHAIARHALIASDGPGAHRPPLRARLRDARGVLRSNLSLRSAWLRSSVRGAVGLGLAVLVARELAVEHSFWVVLATLSVLRTSALGTGSTLLRALAGTLAGIVVGGLLLVAVGSHETVLWVVLPIVTLVAAYASTGLSFAAGQCAFSIVILVIFNLLDPVGWTVGIVRVENVAVGAAVSLLTGLALWPSGTGRLVREGLASAYRQAAAFVGAALSERLLHEHPRPASVEHAALLAETARLDANVRAYLAEQQADRRLAHVLPRLTAGVARLRLAGETTLRYATPRGQGPAPGAAVVQDHVDHLQAWFVAFADRLEERRPGPEPEDRTVDRAAIVALVDGARGRDETHRRRTIAVAFAALHVESLRRLEPLLDEALAAR